VADGSKATIPDLPAKDSFVPPVGAHPAGRLPEPFGAGRALPEAASGRRAWADWFPGRGSGAVGGCRAVEDDFITLKDDRHHA